MQTFLPAVVLGRAVPKIARIISRANGDVNDGSDDRRFRVARVRTFAVTIAFVACILVPGVVTVGCISSESRAERLYRAAKKHVRAGELEQAVEQYELILERFPGTDAAKRAGREVVLYRGLAEAVRLYPVRRARELIVRVARAVQRHRVRRRSWPDSLNSLVPDYLDEIPVDPWGRQLVYRAKPRGRGYWLACFGADGEAGGEGEDVDWYVEDGEFVTAPPGGLR
jgi:hypothetical protein